MRLVASAIPIAASTAAALGIGRLLPHPEGVLEALAWWLALALGSIAALVVFERPARLLLPLAALLKLSLVFPGPAPSRARVAFRSATVRNVERRLDHPDGRGFGEEPMQAAVTVITLVGALTLRGRGIRGHSERVRAFSELLGKELRLPDHDLDRLQWAALLHDVGKLHVPHRIINKSSEPTAEEWDALKCHPEHGARIAAPLATWLGPWADGIAQHHERWDGSGYPRGLAGLQISLGARVVAVIDAFDAMTTPRPYKRPLSAERARQELVRRADGSQFDPVVVRSFLHLPTGQVRRIMSPVAWVVQLPLLASIPRIQVAASVTREALTTAGAAAAVGVLAGSGIIQGELPLPIPPPSALAPAAPAAPASKSAAPDPRRDTAPAGPTSPSPPPPPAASSDVGRGRHLRALALLDRSSFPSH